MKVNKVICYSDDERISEAKQAVADILKEEGAPDDVLAITSVGFIEGDPQCPVIYLVNKTGKEFKAAVPRQALRELCKVILEELDETEAEGTEQNIQ